jgi:hypothetical protein
MFTQSTYATGGRFEPGDPWLHSDGSPRQKPVGQTVRRTRLEAALPGGPSASKADLVQSVVRAVVNHTGEVRLADDLMILLFADRPPQRSNIAGIFRSS